MDFCKKTALFGAIIGGFSLLGCRPERESVVVSGYQPVYAPKNQLFEVSAQPPTPVQRAGKIYIHDSLLLINERWRGLHIYNNIDPANPRPIAFLRVPGSLDISAKNQYLYIDNFTDLLVWDITNPAAPQLVTRIHGFYPETVFLYPPFAPSYFTCVDTTKGFPIDWEEAQLTDPRCSMSEVDRLIE